MSSPVTVALDRAPCAREVGHQLAQRARIEHRAGDAVRADLGGLLDDRDRHLAERRPRRRAGRDRLVVSLDQLVQVDRRRRGRRARRRRTGRRPRGLRARAVIAHAPGRRPASTRGASCLEAALGVDRRHAARCRQRSPPGGTPRRPRRQPRTRPAAWCAWCPARRAGSRCSSISSWPLNSAVLGWCPMAMNRPSDRLIRTTLPVSVFRACSARHLASRAGLATSITSVFEQPLDLGIRARPLQHDLRRAKFVAAVDHRDLGARTW